MASICSSINRKLYSIKRLFYLSSDVKLQFMKTFNLPFFDYYLSLIIYFSHVLITKLYNIYYHCLSKLFNLDFSNNSVSEIDNKLKKLNFFSFSHRVLYRLFALSFKLFDNPNAPPLLNAQLIPEQKPEVISSYDFRPMPSANDYIKLPRIEDGELTFGYFFKKFYTKFNSTILSYNLKDLKKHI